MADCTAEDTELQRGRAALSISQCSVCLCYRGLCYELLDKIDGILDDLCLKKKGIRLKKQTLHTDYPTLYL